MIDCENCKGTGHVNNVRYYNYKHIDDALCAGQEPMIKCRECKGSGLMEGKITNKQKIW